MASFPTSVYAPAAKAAGATIQPAHVNDLDNEVAAIEDGYLNATARLNSSNSTVANLSVAGGSTFAGNLLPASDSTLSLGSTSKRWNIHGSQIMTGTVPSTALRNAITYGVQLSTLSAGSTRLENFALVSSASVEFLHSTVAITIGGLAGGWNGRVVTLINDDAAASLTLLHASTGSASSNQCYIHGGNPHTIGAYGGIGLVYNGPVTKWFVMST